MPLLLCLSALIVVFIAAPLVVAVVVSFDASPLMLFPPKAFSLRWYDFYFRSREWLNATLISFQVAVGVSCLATILGTAAAFALRKAFRGRDILRDLLLAPMVVPAIVVAIATYFFFVPLTKAGIPLLGSRLGLIVAHTTLAIPFVVMMVTATLNAFDSTWERAAASCGATQWQTFRRVTLPLIAPGVLSGSLFAFVASFDEVVIALFLKWRARSHSTNKDVEGVRFEIDPTLPAVATLLTVFSILVLGVTELLKRRSERIGRLSQYGEGG